MTEARKCSARSPAAARRCVLSKVSGKVSPIMPIHKLSQSKLNALVRDKHTGRIGDGGGLYLDLDRGTGHWLFRFKRFYKTKYLGIGSTNTVTVGEGRDIDVGQICPRCACPVFKGVRTTFAQAEFICL